jgi:phage repressor protein C with HTH and peptisase S24 domain
MTDNDDIEEAISNSVLALWHKHRTRKRESAFFQDDKFVEWIAREERASLEDGSSSIEFTDEECDEVARSIQSHAAAAKARLKRVSGSPGHHRPEVAGSAAKVAAIASANGYAPFIELAVAAGVGRELWDEDASSWVRLPAGFPKGSYVALKVNGDSMIPLLHSGDVMVVRLDSPFSSGDIVVARLEDGGFVVKRVGRVEDQFIELLSINASYPSLHVHRSSRPVVGTVVLCWCEHEAPPR